MRVLFATAMLYGGVGDSQALWTQFGVYLSDDLPHELQRLRIAIPLHLEQPHLDYGLYLLLEYFKNAGNDLDEYELPLL